MRTRTGKDGSQAAAAWDSGFGIRESAGVGDESNVAGLPASRCRGSEPLAGAARDSPLVVKIGGNELARDGFLERLGTAVAAIVGSGRQVVLVHGGGREVDRWLASQGVLPRYVDGQRVTDPATLEVVEAVLCGGVNKQLVRALLATGVRALGVSGNDLGLLPVEPWPGLDRVGRPSVADRQALEGLLGVCDALVLAPLGIGADGLAYNVNADHAAAAVAAALGADLALVTDVPGVLRDGILVDQLDLPHARQLMADGVIVGGMVPKVEAAFGALARGARAAIVVDLAGLGRSGTRMRAEVRG